MTMTASSAQLAAQPIQNTTTSSTVVSTGGLFNGGSFSSVYYATGDEIVFAMNPAGTLSNDCTLQLQISINGSNYAVLRTFTNAEITAADGFAAPVKLGVNTQFRFRFVPGTTAANAANNVTVRFKN